MQRVPQLAVPSEHSQSHFFPLSTQPSTKSPFCGLWLVVFAGHHRYLQVYHSYLISYDPLIPLIYSEVGISPCHQSGPRNPSPQWHLENATQKWPSSSLMNPAWVSTQAAGQL